MYSPAPCRLDGVDEFVSLARLVRLQLEPDVAVLAAAAGLLDELAFHFHRLLDGFAVGDLRLADVGLDTELALHAVDDDFQVQLAHPGDDGLPGFLVGVDAERRIFLRQAVECNAHLFLVGLGLGFHRLGNDRLGNTMRSSVMTLSGWQSVSPVEASLRPTAAAMSPANTSLISSRWLACICSRRPMRSLRPRTEL